MLNQIDSQLLIVRPGQNMNMLRGQADGSTRKVSIFKHLDLRVLAGG